MKCPSLKTLHDWKDRQCELDAAALEHVQNCTTCLSFLEQTSHAPELEHLVTHTMKERFGYEPEFLELQARLKSLAKAQGDDHSRDSVCDLNHIYSACNDQTQAQRMGLYQTEGDSRKKTVDQESGGQVDLESLQARIPDQRYRLMRILGRGGCGLVVLAFDTKLNREVAIKFLVRDSESERQRLRREGRILAELDHPNIVRIYDVGDLDNPLGSGRALFLVMEYVAGGSAAEHPWEREGSFRELAAMLVGVARGLQLAHNQGLVHRDLKPSNLLFEVEKRVLKVADFGLAKHVGESATQVTRAGNLVGTPEYMSPEQVLGALPGEGETFHGGESPSTDIYSLGATLYALLTGQPPLTGNPLAILRQIPEVQPVAPSILNPDVPKNLELICQHAMEKSPARRYVSMQALAEDLQRFVDGRSVLARAPSWWRKNLDWCSRNKALASTLVSLFFSLIAGFMGTTWMWVQASNNAKKTMQYSSSLETNRKRLRESVSRFQQRIFSEEAMHWQMTEVFRREMFTDVIAYLDEFSELLPESERDFKEFEQLISDYLMLSKAAREVDQDDDAILAADRAVQLMRQHHDYWNSSLARQLLFLQFRVTSAACRARIPFHSFLNVHSNDLSCQGRGLHAADDIAIAKQLALDCESLVQQAQRRFGAIETIVVATTSDDQFRWLLAKRECVMLSVASHKESTSRQMEEARKTFDQCLHEIERGETVMGFERQLLVGELGWDLAWTLTGRLLENGHREVVDGCQTLVAKMRNASRSLEMQLTNSDWMQGSILARKAILLNQMGDVDGAIEAGQGASSSFDKAIEMRPQNRKWIEESVRLELLRSEWLAQKGELETATPLLVSLIKKALRLSKSSPEDYELRKRIIKLFVRLADLSLAAGNRTRAREEYYVAAQDCRIVLMNDADHDWVMQLRPWLLAQVIALDEDHMFRDGPLKQEASFLAQLKRIGLDDNVFQEVLQGQKKPLRPSQLEPQSILHALLYE